MSAAPTRVVRHPLACRLEPHQAALVVRDDPRPFALIGDWAGGGALIGSDPVRVATGEEDPFGLLDEQPVVSPAPDGAVGGGWFGYFGYQLGRRLEPVGPGPPPPHCLAAFELAFYDHLLHADAAGRWWFEALWTARRAPALRRRLAELSGRLAQTQRPRPFATAPWSRHPGDAGHLVAVEAARQRIGAGDIFQANICRRLRSRLAGDPLDLFVCAVPRLRPARGAFLAGPWGAVASLSPELFVERRGRLVRSAPIKGTGQRSPEPAAATADLAASGKDRAENVMIVDLVRNDLGRVCRVGSIEVPVLVQEQAHTGVRHLVSEITGVLGPTVADADLMRAAFPPGSVTGAPKIAAMDVIAELESSPREVYTGAIGFASPVAGLELSVAIRTFEFRHRHVWLGVGGGIVADSDPPAELAECEIKARPLLAAIGGRLAAARPTGDQSPPPHRLRARPVKRPDPAAGVFETLLVRDGRPVALPLHLARLAASCGALYGRALPLDLAQRLRRVAGEPPDAQRLRVSVRPVPGGLEVAVLATGLASGRPAVRLRRTTLPGGLGAHKWCDRGLLDALAEAAAPDQPLLCDLDGQVLETGRANLFLVDPAGVLVTPPVAGRLLPGITRSRVLVIARGLGLEVRHAQVRLDDLRRAREVFVTGSLAGVETVAACDSHQLAGDAEVTGRLILALAS